MSIVKIAYYAAVAFSAVGIVVLCAYGLLVLLECLIKHGIQTEEKKR